MSKIMEFVHEHPYGTAIGVFVIGAVVVLMLHGSSGTTASAGNDDVAAGDAAAAAEANSNNELAAAQLGAQTQANEVNAAASAQNTQTAAAVTIAGLQAGVQTNADTLSAQTTQAVAALQAQVANQTSTLSAQVQEAGITATTDQASIASQTYLGMSADQVQESLASTAAEVQIANAPYIAATTIAGLQFNASNAYLLGANTEYNQDLAATGNAPNLFQDPPSLAGVYQGAGNFVNPFSPTPVTNVPGANK